MRWKKILFSVGASAFNLINGALIGALLGTPAAKGQMLAAGAIVFFYLIIGAVFGLALTLFLAWRWDSTRMRNLAIGSGVLALLLVGITYTMVENRRAEREKQRQETEVRGEALSEEPRGSDTVRMTEKTQPLIERRAGPNPAVEGLGIVQVPHSPDGIRLYFYPTSAVYDTQPTDSLVYRYENGTFSLVHAPPFLQAFYQKVDYEALLFRFTGVHRQAVQLELNREMPRRMWVAREAVSVQFWPDFLAGVATVRSLDDQRNPVRRRALTAAPTADFPEGTQWMPEVVVGDWIGVKPLMPDESSPDIQVWLRWKKDDQLLVSWDYFL